MNRRTLRLLAPVAFAATLTAACGSGGGGESAATTTSSVPEAEGTGPASVAATLPAATLASLLQEHVYLAGITTRQAITGGDPAPAAAALDENSQAIAGAIGGLYGAAAGEAFLPLWRAHIGMFVDYTTGAASGDEATVAKAEADLAQYALDFGAFLESANPNLTQEAVASLLGPHVATLTAAIDAQVAGSDDQFDKLREAAHHMPVMAATLTGAIQRHAPDTVTGSLDSIGATVRVELTDTLQEHVYLAGIATGTAIAGGPFEAAAEALDANSVGLANLIGVTYGDEARALFLDQWREHIGFFVEYTKAAAAGDAAGRRAAADDLDAYAEDFGRFLAETNPELDADVVAEGLRMHAETLQAVIDAQAAGDPAQFLLLREAAGHMPDFAELLASAIVAQFPARFGS